MGLTILLILLWNLHVRVSCVTFDTPPRRGDTKTISEDAEPGSNIYPLQATDPFGHLPIFEIVLPNPTNLTIDKNSDYLIVPSQGLDAEKVTKFVFKFRVKAGTASTDSGLLTVRVTDVNDNAPVFQSASYAANIWKNDHAGTRIVTVNATDPDISNLTISYSIAGAQTTFSVDKLGVITLADPVGLSSLSSPTVLQVQASDGGRTATVAVKIILNDDPCSSTPCKNGGTCTSEREKFSCSCFSGYSGTHCESVDYCYASPCKKGATCTSHSTGYTCYCAPLYFSPNCTCVLKTAKKLFGKKVNVTENSPDDTEIYTFHKVHKCSTDYEANINITLISASTHFRMDGMRLLAKGLDAETRRIHRLKFRVTAETVSLDGGPMKVKILDVNDNDPEFRRASYTGKIWRNNATGTRIVKIKAKDPDISKMPISYTIAGKQTAFSVNNSSGVITLDKPSELTSLYSPTVLQVQASDGERTANVTVNITINDNVTCFKKYKKMETCGGLLKNKRFTSVEACCAKKGKGFTIQKLVKLQNNVYTCTSCEAWKHSTTTTTTTAPTITAKATQSVRGSGVESEMAEIGKANNQEVRFPERSITRQTDG